VLEESASDRRTSAGGIANWRPHVEGACIPALLPLPLQNNADLTVEDRSGWTPLHFAARTGARNVVQVCPHLRAAGNICARTWPQICADSSKAAPGLTRVGAGTRPYLRRDWPASAQRLTHICTGTGPRLRRDWPTSTSAPGLARICICAGTGPTFVQQLPGNCMCGSFMGGVCTTAPRMHRQPRKLRPLWFRFSSDAAGLSSRSECRNRWKRSNCSAGQPSSPRSMRSESNTPYGSAVRSATRPVAPVRFMHARSAAVRGGTRCLRRVESRAGPEGQLSAPRSFAPLSLRASFPPHARLGMALLCRQ
jgi:hypothetical protein